MRILVAPDSFKGSLDARAAAEAIARGLAGHEVDLCPLSDGGEGFLAVLGVPLTEAATTDALGEPITAAYGRVGDTVYVELARAAGLAQLDRRDPLAATTYGVGTLIAAAWPFRRLVLSLGGSATVDGGAGLLAALGARLLDETGQPVPPGGGALRRIARADLSDLHPALHAEIRLAVDVTNPLLGERGAAAVYGPQKGASPADVALLDRNLRWWADILVVATGNYVHAVPGGGAAGGVAAALIALGASGEPGFELVAEAVDLDARIAACDAVVTGEGRFDASSLEGKVVGRLADRCRAAGKPLLVLAGGTDGTAAGFPMVVPPGITPVHAAGPLKAAVAAAASDGCWLPPPR